MACFTAPAVEAVVTTIAAKVIKNSESKMSESEITASGKIPFSKKLSWLNGMLWGGSALLAFEHIWHGEITAWPPFLTAAADPADFAEMLNEIATSGVAMALLVTAVWGVMVAVVSAVEKRAQKEKPAEEV